MGEALAMSELYLRASRVGDKQGAIGELYLRAPPVGYSTPRG
jgi:hypothetical protein